MNNPGMTPRGKDGRFLLIQCSDPNCDGILQLDYEYGRPSWICNGLTHDTDDGPLRACDRSYDALAASLPSTNREAPDAP
jgi:hypothetical protein